MDENAKRAAKKAVRAAERASARKALPLDVAELRTMFDWLDTTLGAEPCDHSLRHTLEWLASRSHDAARVVPWLEEHGGYCDCEVVANVEEHVDNALHE